MTSVVIFGEPGKKFNSLKSSVHRGLKAYGGYMSISEDYARRTVIKSSDINPKFHLYESLFGSINIKNVPSVVVANENTGSNMKLELNKKNRVISVVSENSEGAINIFKATNSVVIGCGMASHNTINATSVDDKIIMVSLQRKILTLSNRMIEPMEFRVKLSRNTDIYSILATCAILLVSDIDAKDGYEF